jgi:hypothetical protein
MQIVLAGALHVPPFPQYCFGTFPIHVLFGWFFIDFLRRIRLGVPLAIVWATSLGIVTLTSAWQIHVGGWHRWSPSLDDQIEIAGKLNQYSDESAMTDVDLYEHYPVAMRALRVIMPPGHGESQRESPHGLIIRYRPEPNPSSRIELIESPVDLPDDDDQFQEMDVTPMPKLY